MTSGRPDYHPDVATKAKQDDIVAELEVITAIAALGATEDKQDDIVALAGKMYRLNASDTIQLEDLTESVIADTDFVKLKQFTLLTPGIVRITADIKVVTSGGVQISIRVNDIQITTWATASTGYVSQTADIALGMGDLLQLWCRLYSGAPLGYIINARVKCDSSLGTPAIGVVS